MGIVPCRSGLSIPKVASPFSIRKNNAKATPLCAFLLESLMKKQPPFAFHFKITKEKQPAIAEDQCGSPVRKTSAGDHCRRPVRETSAGDHCRRPVRETSAGDQCGRPVRETSAGDHCRRPVRETSAGDHCRRPLQKPVQGDQ